MKKRRIKIFCMPIVFYICNHFVFSINAHCICNKEKSKSKSNVFTSDPDIKPVEECSNPYLYTSKYIINKVGTIK